MSSLVLSPPSSPDENTSLNKTIAEFSRVFLQAESFESSGSFGSLTISTDSVLWMGQDPSPDQKHSRSSQKNKFSFSPQSLQEIRSEGHFIFAKTKEKNTVKLVFTSVKHATQACSLLLDSSSERKKNKIKPRRSLTFADLEELDTPPPSEAAANNIPQDDYRALARMLASKSSTETEREESAKELTKQGYPVLVVAQIPIAKMNCVAQKTFEDNQMKKLIPGFQLNRREAEKEKARVELATGAKTLPGGLGGYRYVDIATNQVIPPQEYAARYRHTVLCGGDAYHRAIASAESKLNQKIDEALEEFRLNKLQIDKLYKRE